MDPQRKAWNEQQQKLQTALTHLDAVEAALALFLRHHAMVHASEISGSGLWSFEDEALAGLQEADFRVIPPGEEHSLTWILWHIARIEDVTMNMLVAGEDQLFLTDGWKSKIGFDNLETGNALDPAGIACLSQEANIAALRAYRLAVGRRTRAIVTSLTAVELRMKVQPARLQAIFQSGAVVDSTRWLLDYWGKKTIAELLLMPPTRHNFVHLNEAERLKKKLIRLQKA